MARSNPGNRQGFGTCEGSQWQSWRGLKRNSLFSVTRDRKKSYPKCTSFFGQSHFDCLGTQSFWNQKEGIQDQRLMPESARISACRTARARKQSRREKSTVSMVSEGYRSRLCKCNNFNENGLFGRDRLLVIVGNGSYSRKQISVLKDASPIAHSDHPFAFRTSSPPPEAFRREPSATLRNASSPVL